MTDREAPLKPHAKASRARNESTLEYEYRCECGHLLRTWVEPHDSPSHQDVTNAWLLHRITELENANV